MGIEATYPHVEADIVDNSFFDEPVVRLGTVGRFVSKAETGPDNDCQLIHSVGEYIAKYGEINFRKYGQAQYNALAWLANGPILYTRLLPYLEEDPNTNTSIQPSTFSASIIEIGLKTIVDPLVDPKKIKIRVRALGDGLNAAAPADVESTIRTVSAIKSVCLAMPSVAEADGYTYYPLFVLKDKYRGAANSGRLGFNMKLLNTMDDTYDHRLYTFNTFLTTTDGLRTITKDSPFIVSLYPEAMDINNNSQFIGDVLETYSTVFDFIYIRESYDEIMEIINEYINSSAPTKKLDIFTLTERKIRGVAPETYHAGTTLDANSDLIYGTISKPRFSLAGGKDGDWVGPNSYENLLYNAYSGNGDVVTDDGFNLYDTHFSKALDTNYEYDVVLDCNLPQSIRDAMVVTAKSRYDHIVILDTGITSNYRQAIKRRQEGLNYSSYLVSIFTHDFVIADPYNGSKPITVTSTYDLAKRIPLHDKDYHIGKAFVGPRRGAVTGIKSLNWSPSDAAKQELYNNEINYIERTPTELNWMGQLTSQYRKSSLSDINHVRPLFYIKRAVIAIGNRYRFEEDNNIDNTYASLGTEVNDLLARCVSMGYIRTGNATVSASDYEKKLKLVRVNIDVTFGTIIERVYFTINVNA